MNSENPKTDNPKTENPQDAPQDVEVEDLVEEVSIDGMCGVY